LAYEHGCELMTGLLKTRLIPGPTRDKEVDSSNKASKHKKEKVSAHSAPKLREKRGVMRCRRRQKSAEEWA